MLWEREKKEVDSKKIFCLTPRKCIKFLVLYCVVMNGLCTVLRLSTAIFYLCDVVNILLMIFMTKNLHLISKNSLYKWLFRVFISILIFVLINQVFNFVPIALALWGDRNFLRFYILFFCVLAFCEKQDIDDIMNSFYWLQIFNGLFGAYKYGVLGLQEDAFGGGMFLNGSGMCLFCVLVTVYYMNRYLEKRSGLFKMLMMLFISMFLAVIAEEKFLMLTGMFGIILTFFMSRMNYRKIIMGISGVCTIVLAITILKNVVPDSFKILTNISSLTEYASMTHDTGYRIPRLGAFTTIEELFMKSEFSKWIGLGLGNCDTSSFSFLESDFYQKYGQYNYRWFTHQWTYLEMGRIGFALYLLFFVLILILLIKNIVKVNGDSRIIISSSITFTIIAIMFCWQNSAMRVDTAYYVYFGMAMGLVAVKSELQKNNGIEELKNETERNSKEMLDEK